MFLVAPLLFAFLFLVPGTLAVLACTQRRTRGALPTALEAALLSVVFSLLLTTGLAHGLASIGAFSRLSLLVAVGVFVVPLAALAIRRRTRAPAWRARPRDVWAVLLLVGFGVVYAPPSEYVFGQHDEGTYLNAAARIATHGGIWFDSAFLGELDSRWWRAHDDLFLPGFYFAEVGRPTIAPHGFHFFTAFLAALHAVGGLEWTFAGPTILMLVTLAGFVVIATRLAGPFVGFAAGVLLGSNPMSVWFSRITFAEGMSEALLVSAGALLLCGWPPGRAPRPRGAAVSALQLLVAGAALGAVHLTKVEFLPLPFVMAGFAIVVGARGLPDRTTRLVPIGYTAFLALGLWFAGTTHELYTRGTISKFLLAASGEAWGSPFREAVGRAAWIGLASLGASVIALVVLGRVCRGLIARIPGRAVVAIVGVVFMLGVAYLWCVPPQLLSWENAAKVEPDRAQRFVAALRTPSDAERGLGHVVRGVARYTTTPALFVGLIGAFVLLARRRAFALAPILAIGLVQTLLYLAVSLGVDSGMFPHFHSYRRFLNVTLPLVLLGAVVPWFAVDGWRRRPVVAIVGAVGGTALLAWVGVATVRTSEPHLSYRFWTSSRETVRGLASRAPEDAVWFAAANDPLAMRLLVPLHCLEGRATFVVREPLHDRRALATVVDRCRALGRTPVLLFGSGEAPWVARIERRLGASRTTMRIVEKTVVGRRRRVPDARDRLVWEYDMVIVQP